MWLRNARDGCGLEMLECGDVEIGEHQQLGGREAVGVAFSAVGDGALADLALGLLDIRARGAAAPPPCRPRREIVAREVLDRVPESSMTICSMNLLLMAVF